MEKPIEGRDKTGGLTMNKRKLKTFILVMSMVLLFSPVSMAALIYDNNSGTATDTFSESSTGNYTLEKFWDFDDVLSLTAVNLAFSYAISGGQYSVENKGATAVVGTATYGGSSTLSSSNTLIKDDLSAFETNYSATTTRSINLPNNGDIDSWTISSPLQASDSGDMYFVSQWDAASQGDTFSLTLGGGNPTISYAGTGTQEVSFNNETTVNSWVATVTYSYTGDAPSTVPEPATMVLFGAGLLGIAGVSRKKFLANR
jgi:hypothetical protein